MLASCIILNLHDKINVMKQAFSLIFLAMLFTAACKGPVSNSNERVVTVSIPPFKYFVEAIADSDFVINVMLPQGADHHSWEPLPAQITALSGSEAFITNGYLGFELAWMERFKEVNPRMKIVSLSKGITLLEPEEDDEHGHTQHAHEGADPHYWISPKAAYAIAANVREIMTELNPSQKQRYDSNFLKLIEKISLTDTIVTREMRNIPSRSFMIFHPALAYMAKDYGLEQISFEDEGKAPSPSRMKELIDLTREKEMKVILIQSEYDVKSAEVLAAETDTKLVVINPLNPEWDSAVIEISNALAGKTKK